MSDAAGGAEMTEHCAISSTFTGGVPDGMGWVLVNGVMVSPFRRMNPLLFNEVKEVEVILGSCVLKMREFAVRGREYSRLGLGDSSQATLWNCAKLGMGSQRSIQCRRG